MTKNCGATVTQSNHLEAKGPHIGLTEQSKFRLEGADESGDWRTYVFIRYLPKTASKSKASSIHPCRSTISHMAATLTKTLISAVSSRRILAFENVALCHQFGVLQRSFKRPLLKERDRLMWVLLSRFWTDWT